MYEGFIETPIVKFCNEKTKLSRVQANRIRSS